MGDKPGSEEDRINYPASYPCNIWPDDSLLPGFELAAKSMGQLMHHVVVEISKHIDACAKVSIEEGYKEDLLYNALKDTEKVKCRLLYYYPVNSSKEDSWIGWHNDSGFLTALAGDIYIDE